MGRSRPAPPGVAIVNVSPNSDFLNLRYLPAPFGALGGGPKYEGGRGASWIMIDCTTTVRSTIVIFSVCLVCLPGVATFWVNCMTGVVFRVQFRDFGHGSNTSIIVPQYRDHMILQCEDPSNENADVATSAHLSTPLSQAYSRRLDRKST